MSYEDPTPEEVARADATYRTWRARELAAAAQYVPQLFDLLRDIWHAAQDELAPDDVPGCPLGLRQQLRRVDWLLAQIRAEERRAEGLPEWPGEGLGWMHGDGDGI